MTTELPAIYIFANNRIQGEPNCIALAEDGTCVGGHFSSSNGFARLDMGLVEGHDWSKKNEGYAKHYPNGYRLVDLIESGPLVDAGCKALLDRLNAESRSEATPTAVSAPALQETR